MGLTVLASLGALFWAFWMSPGFGIRALRRGGSGVVHALGALALFRQCSGPAVSVSSALSWHVRVLRVTALVAQVSMVPEFPRVPHSAFSGSALWVLGLVVLVPIPAPSASLLLLVPCLLVWVFRVECFRSCALGRFGATVLAVRALGFGALGRTIWADVLGEFGLLGMGCFGPILETGLFGAFWKSDFGVRHRPDEPSRAKRGVGFGPARRRF